MPHTLIRVTFEDYDKWKAVFDEAAALRRAYSSKGVRVFRVANKPNEVVILAEYAEVEKARQLFQSKEFREATHRAGVSGPPEVSFLDEAYQLEA
jgi:hypothetical protein